MRPVRVLTIGARFWELTVVGIQGSDAALCRCSCGRYRDASPHNLRSGRSWWCGVRDDHPGLRREPPGYLDVHDRLLPRLRGPARDAGLCEYCGVRPAREWSLRPGVPTTRDHPGGYPFSRDVLTAYAASCARCHHLADAHADRAQGGVPLFEVGGEES